MHDLEVLSRGSPLKALNGVSFQSFGYPGNYLKTNGNGGGSGNNEFKANL